MCLLLENLPVKQKGFWQDLYLLVTLSLLEQFFFAERTEQLPVFELSMLSLQALYLLCD